MLGALVAVLVLYLAYLMFRLRGQNPKTLADFFSFGNLAEPKNLRDAFFVTNASFATAFVSLFMFVGSQGIFSIVTPIAFVFGAIFYTYVLLPRQLRLLASQKRYPQLLGEATGSRVVRLFSSLFVIFSLWLFTYTEIHGLASFFATTPEARWTPFIGLVASIATILLMGIYTFRSGFSGVVSSDASQRWLISIGALALVCLAAYDLFGSAGAAQRGTAFFLSATPEAFQGWPGLAFIVETTVGFLFSQLLYYDNWQRISAYYKVRERMLVGASTAPSAIADTILREVRQTYAAAAGLLLLLYFVPIGLAFAALASVGAASSPADLVAYLHEIWARGWLEKALMVLAFSYLVAALISTLEVYVISIVNNVLDDITGMLASAQSATGDGATLLLARVLAFFCCLTFVPALLVAPDFEAMFVYMFYSANGLVGPLLLLLLNRPQSKTATLVALAIGLAYPLVSQFLKPVATFSYPGTVTVLLSILVSSIGSALVQRGAAR